MTATAAPIGAPGLPRRAAMRDLLSGVGTIMSKELRSRMRGRRAFVVLTVYLGILALLTYGVYIIVAPNARASGMGLAAANASALVGQSIFAALSIFQLVLVCFIAPAFTAGQISLEREKQTLDLLVSTPMRPTAIVLGKLAAALAFVVLMIVAAVPIVAIVLMYGGATIGDIVRQQLVLLVTALALGAVGLFYSALLKRTQAATVLTYITMLALTLGTGLIFIFWTVVANQTDEPNLGAPRLAPEQVLWLNPGVAMLDVIAPAEPGGGNNLARALAELHGERTLFGGGEVRCDGDICQPVDVFGNPIGSGDTTGHWWPRVGLTYLVGAAILTFLATRLVVPAGMRWAFRRRHSGAAAATGVDGGGPAADTLPDNPTVEELEA
ncbi:MAG TPA: ABC transporter permease subunit [Candidatus Limnocylindria bacterium]|nr:ABC transporter permease subunit [Candidatus Limnocylindria bacterium]